MQSHQPGWMAHWMRTSSSTTAERRDDGACGNKEFDRVSRDDHIALEAPRSVKDPGEIEANAESLRVSSKSFGNEGMFSVHTEHGQETGGTRAIRPIIDHNLDCGKTMNYEGGIKLSSGILAVNENFSREYRSSIEGTSMKPPELVKTQFSAKDGSSSTSMFSRERCVGPSTHIVPYHDLERYKFDKGKAVVCPPISRPSSVVFNNQLPDRELKIIGQHGQKHFQWESVMGNHSGLDTSINACFGDRNTSFLSDPPSMIDQDQPRYGKDWLQKMQKCSRVISMLPSQFSKKNEQKVPCYDHYPLQKFPSCVHETMRICTTVDSVEAPPTGCPWFSQTTHSLLITKNTDVNVSKETDIFRRLITQMNGNSSSDLECVPSFIGQANRGVILQPISSSNSEGQGNVGNTGIGTSKYASKNESSAETDTMDIDFSKEEIPNCGMY